MLTYVKHNMPIQDKKADAKLVFDADGKPVMIKRKDANGNVTEVQRKARPMVNGTVEIPQAEQLEDFLDLHSDPERVVQIINAAISRRWREVTSRGGDPLAISDEDRVGMKAAKDLAKKIAKLDVNKLDEIKKLLAAQGIEI